MKMKRSDRITPNAMSFVGTACNCNCTFCYYRQTPNRTWTPIDYIKKQLTQMRDFYGIKRVSFSGGDASIYPGILEALRHAKMLGLETWMITNGFVVPARFDEFREAGLNKYVFSLHGANRKLADGIVRREGAFANMMAAMDRCKKEGFTFAVNTTTVRANYKDLKNIARLIIDKGCCEWSIINFAPWHDWLLNSCNSLRSRWAARKMFVKLKKAGKAMQEAARLFIRIKDDSVRINIPFIPYCTVEPDIWPLLFGLKTTSYHFCNWDFASWYRHNDEEMEEVREEGVRNGVTEAHPGELYWNAMGRVIAKTLFTMPPECHRCSHIKVCDGFTYRYADHFGMSEAQPINGPLIEDPGHFKEKVPWKSHVPCMKGSSLPLPPSRPISEGSRGMSSIMTPTARVSDFP